MNIALKSMF